MTKHTPGPWKWVDSYDHNSHVEHRKQGLSADCENISAGRIELISESTGKIVLKQWGDYCDDSGVDVSMLDARLIETVPDLFRLAKEALSQLRFYNYEVRVTIGNHDKELIEALEAVVAKVEGQQ